MQWVSKCSDESRRGLVLNSIANQTDVLLKWKIDYGTDTLVGTPLQI